MSKFKKTNKQPMHDILVASGNQALASGAFTTSGVALNIASGQLGALSWDPGSATAAAGNFIAATDDSNDVQAIKLVQGTPASANVTLASIWEDTDKGYVESGVISKTNIRSVAVTRAKLPVYGSQVIANVTEPQDDLEYRAYVRLLSVRNDRQFGDNDEVVHAIVPAIDFALAGTVDPTDYVLQKLAIDLNLQSKAVSTGNASFKKGNRNFLVFGVNIAGGSGKVIGTTALNDSISVMTSGGVTTTFVADHALLGTLATLVQNDATLTATSTIEVLDASTAGAAAKVDALIIIGLTEKIAAAYDDVEQVMVQPELNLAGGFRAVGSTFTTTSVNYKEGTGQGRKWLIEWRHRAGLNVHTAQIQPHGDWFIEGKNYINTDWMYTSYNIEYFDTEDTLTTTEVSPKLVTMLFRAEIPSTATLTVNGCIVEVAAGREPIPTITSDGAGTGTAGTTMVTSVNNIISAWLEHARVNGNPFRVLGDAVAAGTYLS